MSETNFLLKRSNGQVEISKNYDKLSADKLSFLAPIAQSTPDRTFTILAGSIYVSDTDIISIAETIVNMGPGGGYQTTAITSTWYNKAYFTVNSAGTILMYEGTAAAASGSVGEPVLPDNELPICTVLFQDDGSAGAGTIVAISQSMIIDRRPWMNLGNLDNISFKPIYKDNSNFIIQKGSGWFNNQYLTLSANTSVAGTVSSDTTYYIYLDYNNASGGVTASSFATMTLPPLEGGSVDLRRYTPLGQYTVTTGQIQRTGFTAYGARFWQYRDKAYLGKETQTAGVGGDTTFTFTTFTFTDTDHLSANIEGIEVSEGVSDDFVRSSPNQLIFNYNVEEGSAVTLKKL